MQNLNPHEEWRLALARQIAERLRPFEGIQAMVVGGSVARDYADAYSDLEIPLFWDKLPGDDVRQAVIAALGAELLYPYNGPANEDNLLIQGFQVDLWHAAVASEDRIIESVLQDYSTDLGASNFLDTLRACIPLTGETIVSRWKSLAAEYPPVLARRNISLYLQDFNLKQLHLAVQRDNPTLFYQTLTGLQESLFKVLLALNKAYYPTLKWIYPTIERLAIVPDETGPRLRRMFKLPHSQALVPMQELLAETLDLVAQHYPDIDLAPARRSLSMVREAVRRPINLYGICP